MRNGVDTAVKGAAENGGELVNQGLPSSPLRIRQGALGGILGRGAQEGGPRPVVGHQNAGHRPALQVLAQRGNTVGEAGRFQDHKFPRLFHQKHLVRQRIAGLIGVELHTAEVVDVHLALAQRENCKTVLVHRNYLQMARHVYGIFSL